MIHLKFNDETVDVTKETINKIPYFRDMLSDCGYVDKAINVDRPSKTFKHVLAYIIDDLYPYPAKYSHELDFYGIEYNKDKLYNPNKGLLERIEKLGETNKELFERIEKLEETNEELLERIEELEEDIKSKDILCLVCGNKHIANSLFCKTHKNYCAYYKDGKHHYGVYKEEGYCTNGSYGYNYCNNKHLNKNKLCDEGGCRKDRCEGDRYCIRHKNR